MGPPPAPCARPSDKAELCAAWPAELRRTQAVDSRGTLYTYRCIARPPSRARGMGMASRLLRDCDALADWSRENPSPYRRPEEEWLRPAMEACERARGGVRGAARQASPCGGGVGVGRAVAAARASRTRCCDSPVQRRNKRGIHRASALKTQDSVLWQAARHTHSSSESLKRNSF